MENEERKNRTEEPAARTGLVLEGGGMRGIYTAGVLDVFLDKNLHFDGVIGVSAGAIHGCSFVSGQKGRSIRYYKKYCRDKRFMSVRNLVLTGDIAGEQFCYHDLPERLDPYDYDAFNRSGTEFYACCSNVETGEAEYLRITDMRIDIRIAYGLLLLCPMFPAWWKSMERSCWMEAVPTAFRCWRSAPWAFQDGGGADPA